MISYADKTLAKPLPAARIAPYRNDTAIVPGDVHAYGGGADVPAVPGRTRSPQHNDAERADAAARSGRHSLAGALDGSPIPHEPAAAHHDVVRARKWCAAVSSGLTVAVFASSRWQGGSGLELNVREKLLEHHRSASVSRLLASSGTGRQAPMPRSSYAKQCAWADSAEALSAAEEAMGLYRTLCADDPVFQPDLADTLRVLANCYDTQARSADALAALEEAVAVYRRVAAASPHVHHPELAGVRSGCFPQLVQVGEPFRAASGPTGRD